MRVGEPIIGVAENFWGVAPHFITAAAAKKINHYLFKLVRLHYSVHPVNEIAHPTLWSQ
jgi:hypothetical protein